MTGFANPDGIVGPEDSDQTLIINADKTRLFAVNGGSDTIAVFSIATDRGPQLVPEAPFPSGGRLPVSLGLMNGRVYVVNKDPDQITPG